MLGITGYIYYIIILLEPAPAIYYLFITSFFPIFLVICPIVVIFLMIFWNWKKRSQTEKLLFILTDRRFIAYFNENEIYSRTRSPTYAVSSLSEPLCIYYGDIMLPIFQDEQQFETILNTLKSWNKLRKFHV